MPWKRVDEVIECLAECSGANLKVVGDGPERIRLERIATEVGLSDRVAFLGALPRERALWEMSTSDVVVLNSDYEGLPHVVVEAMSLGKPVVARYSGGSEEVVRHEETGFTGTQQR